MGQDSSNRSKIQKAGGPEPADDPRRAAYPFSGWEAARSHLVDRMKKYWTEMKMGSWIVIAILLAFLIAAIWLGHKGWTMDSNVQVSKQGYIAMALGTVFSLVIGIGLMALIFYSSRAGYDEPPHLIKSNRDPGEK
jgi:hypothetical protein